MHGVMAVRRILRRSLVTIAILLLLLVVAGLTYRYWMGAALRPVASRFGVHFEKYERLEDGRFALSGIVRSNALFDLRISRVEGFFPDVWYSKIKKPGTNSTTPFVLINGWKLVVHTNQLQGTGTPASATNRTAYDWFKLAKGNIICDHQFIWGRQVT